MHSEHDRYDVRVRAASSRTIASCSWACLRRTSNLALPSTLLRLRLDLLKKAASVVQLLVCALDETLECERMRMKQHRRAAAGQSYRKKRTTTQHPPRSPLGPDCSFRFPAVDCIARVLHVRCRSLRKLVEVAPERDRRRKQQRMSQRRRMYQKSRWRRRKSIRVVEEGRKRRRLLRTSRCAQGAAR